MKNQYIGGNCLKGRGLRQFEDLRGGELFEGGGDAPMHAMTE